MSTDAGSIIGRYFYFLTNTGKQELAVIDDLTVNPQVRAQAKELYKVGYGSQAHCVAKAQEGVASAQATMPAPRPTAEPYTIAVVDDSSSDREVFSRTIMRQFGGSLITPFSSCEELMVALQAGKRFKLYTVDNNMGPTHMKGFECVARILALHPGAVVMGLTSDNVEKQFTDAGAKGFIGKDVGPGAFLRMVEQLLKLP